MSERIWIYTLSRPLEAHEIEELKGLCRQFVSGWTAHEVSLDASYELYKDRLLIFKVNEAKYNASGCSIDKQLRFVKELENKFKVELLNRLLVAYETNGGVEVVKQSAVPGLLEAHVLNENTVVFNNVISSSDELDSSWRLPLRSTWLSRYLVQQDR